MLKSRDIRKLDIDELRSLVNYADRINETFNTGDVGEMMDAQGILDLYWAAEDNGGWDGFQAFWEEDNTKARACWQEVQNGVQMRAKAK